MQIINWTQANAPSLLPDACGPTHRLPLSRQYLSVCSLPSAGCLGHGTFGIVIKALDLEERPPDGGKASCSSS